MPIGLPSLITENHIPVGVPQLSNLVPFMDENTGNWRKCTYSSFMASSGIGGSMGYFDFDNDDSAPILDCASLAKVHFNLLNQINVANQITFIGVAAALFEISLSFRITDYAAGTIQFPANFRMNENRWDFDYQIFTAQEVGYYEAIIRKAGAFWNMRINNPSFQ